MQLKSFLTVVGALLALNVGMVAAGHSSADAKGVALKTCVCINGSDPSGPQGPGEPACIEQLSEECQSVDDCSCPLT